MAGEAIFEIGRRLKHVKENDLAHGEWSKWCKNEIGITRQQADRFIVVFEELGTNDTTSCQIGVSRLYEIATLPPEQRESEHTTSKGEQKTPAEMTVRELRQLKADLKKAEERAELERKERERLEEYANKKPEVRTEYIEVQKESPELRDRSFDTPYAWAYVLTLGHLGR